MNPTARIARRSMIVRRPVCMVWCLLIGGWLPVLSPAQAQTPSAATRAGNALAATSAPAALRVGLTKRTQVVYEPRPWVPAHDLTAALPQERQAALALEFRSPPKDQGARGLLRVRLSGDSVLHFRPRGGGLTVTYRSQF